MGIAKVNTFHKIYTNYQEDAMSTGNTQEPFSDKILTQALTAKSGDTFPATLTTLQPGQIYN